ncbi:MAG: HK97 family phage prohead protease [Hyphomonas sp.]|uniref:HK97 family phage prohead protease n=1 Tax=Hyphomonas sp. TaxID=87 RepID=UPI0017F0FE68|nr:HK97 family phage prohead protease [Hyphomonas sp.]MBA3068181.1 HK97 family phage prohead protease [Hyphomonas sp.]MBU3919843.1 HK97 family phage prohead protease [Alphaproteobacteria bacterium]MBU4062103.1 HK97 family phage prohead protease [Alphaproteobacteria bacterium]MBU4165537.1 HK97 family phage prohead protease [Alphaproteobacteria bacterium]
MTNTIERRAAELEVRAKGRTLEGYAAVFEQRARIVDFDEMIARGAFADTLKAGDKLCLVDHNTEKLLGRTRNGSLRLAEDTRGLHFEIALPKTSLADDVLALADAGSLGGASFGFIPTRETWQGSLRTLHAIDLREISIVSAWPAYPQTSVNARSAAFANRSDLARRIDFLDLGGF